MKTLNIMLKPASSLCNMRCGYCFYADVSDKRQIKSCGIMTESTRAAIIERSVEYLDDGDRAQFVFQGGEPTLAGLSFFESFVAEVNNRCSKISVSYALQTNGLALDRAWCEFLKKNDFLVGISLDILSDCHDSVRKDVTGRGTYRRIAENIRLLDEYGIEYNVLCTLTNEIAGYPAKVWKAILQLGIKYVQFTPCLGELDESKKTPYALTPARFAFFYDQLFGLWLDAFRDGKFVSIKFFDDIMNLLMTGHPTSCGMDGVCRPQMVVEADGSVYPCDFYCLDEYKLGNFNRNSIAEILESPCVTEFVNRPHSAPVLCSDCPYRTFCGGGCRRMQKEICCFADEKFCGYRDFLEKNFEQFYKMAKHIVQSRKRGK